MDGTAFRLCDVGRSRQLGELSAASRIQGGVRGKLGREEAANREVLEQEEALAEAQRRAEEAWRRTLTPFRNGTK